MSSDEEPDWLIEQTSARKERLAAHVLSSDDDGTRDTNARHHVFIESSRHLSLGILHCALQSVSHVMCRHLLLSRRLVSGEFG